MVGCKYSLLNYHVKISQEKYGCVVFFFFTFCKRDHFTCKFIASELLHTFCKLEAYKCDDAEILLQEPQDETCPKMLHIIKSSFFLLSMPCTITSGRKWNKFEGGRSISNKWERHKGWNLRQGDSRRDKEVDIILWKYV